MALCLALGLVLPASLDGKELKLIFSIGGNFRPQPGYSFEYFRKVNPGNAFYPAEYGGGVDRVATAKIYAPEAGFGLGYKNITLALSMSPFTGRFSGTYELVVPSMYVYDLVAADTITAESKVAGTAFAAYLTYSVPLGRSLRGYAGAGAHFLWTKVEVMEDLIYLETHDRVPGIGFTNHVVNITDVVFSEANLSVPSWIAVAGLEFAPVEGYRIFAEGRYRQGKREIPHPYYLRVGNDSTPISLDFSGFALFFGIRLGLEI
jgi:opacity protein-like surface antigen